MRTSRRGIKLAVAALLSALLAAGCTDTNAGQHAVFPDSTGFTSTMPFQVDEITDIGFEPFYNLTGDPIRLRGAAFVSPPPNLHVLNVRALGCPGPSGLRILIGSSPERTGSRGREIQEVHSWVP